MATTHQITEEAFQRIVLAEPDRHWELHDGWLREKPGISWEHGRIVAFLSYLLQHQLDRAVFEVRINEGRVRRSPSSIYIPDIIVVPAVFGERFGGQPGLLAIFPDPLPLVVEVWSLSTGDYDVDAKIPEYQRRGDHEIWRVHPYERTLTAWRREPDGRYAETIYRGGIVTSSALPNVAIDLDELLRG
jgi:Uma2 family endonuclease